jgi:Ca-activated chloride channel family protein
MVKRNFASLIFTALSIFSFAGILSAQEEEPVVKVDSSIVVLNATITDANGKPVSGLKQQQFKIFEDGAEQEIAFFAAEETPFAAVILLDTSGSMEERVSLARAAAIRFLDGLRADDSSAIYRFDSKVTLVQKFSGSRDIDEDIFDVKSKGMTALNDAIFLAAAELSNRPEKRRAIIVLSDGEDTFSKRSAEKALKAALAANAVIYTVDMSAVDTNGARRTQNRGVLKNFAEKTGGMFVSTPGGAAMRDAFKSIVEDLGTQYTLAYQPSNNVKDGKWRALELRVAKPKLHIRTREGYNAEKSN